MLNCARPSSLFVFGRKCQAGTSPNDYLALSARRILCSTGRVGSMFSRAAVASISGKPRAMRASRASSFSGFGSLDLTTVAQ